MARAGAGIPIGIAHDAANALTGVIEYPVLEMSSRDAIREPAPGMPKGVDRIRTSR